MHNRAISKLISLPTYSAFAVILNIMSHDCRNNCEREPGSVLRLLGKGRRELLGFGLELPLGPLRRVLGVGEPGGVEELLVRAVVVADEPELLALPHPPQHDLHLPLARQASKPDILRTMECKDRSSQLLVKQTFRRAGCMRDGRGAVGGSLATAGGGGC